MPKSRPSASNTRPRSCPRESEPALCSLLKPHPGSSRSPPFTCPTSPSQQGAGIPMNGLPQGNPADWGREGERRVKDGGPERTGDWLGVAEHDSHIPGERGGSRALWLGGPEGGGMAEGMAVFRSQLKYHDFTRAFPSHSPKTTNYVISPFALSLPPASESCSVHNL